MLEKIRKTIASLVFWAERNLKGKSGEEKRAAVIERACDAIDVPFVPEFVERPVKRWVFGMIVDAVVEKINWLSDWLFGDIQPTEEQIDKLAEVANAPLAMVASAASAGQSFDERLEELYRQYKIVPPDEPDPEPTAEEEETERERTEGQTVEATDSNFKRSVAFTLKWEGGYVDDPDDPGGETHMGITKGTLAAAVAQGIVANVTVKALTRADAEKIYRVNYWDKYGWDDMGWPVCLCLFDITVNHGGGGMAKIAQRACNRLGGALTVDGKYGPKTRSALTELASRELAQALCDERKAYYDGIIANKPVMEKYRKGWYNRLRDLAAAAGVKSPV